MKPHRGTLVMVLGIISIFACQIILGPIAWIMANNDLKEMAAGTMDPSGEQNTKVGKICGMIGTILGVLGLCCTIIYMVVVVGMIGAAGTSGGATFK